MLYEQSCDDIDGWMNQLESQIITEEAAKDLTTVNLLMQKQNVSKKSQIITEEAARDLTTVNLLMQKQNISKKSQITTGGC